MAQIKWAEPALNNFDEIAEYISLDKPSAAKNLVQEVFKAVKSLKKFLNPVVSPLNCPNLITASLLPVPVEFSTV